MKHIRLLSCLLACAILAGMLSVCGIGALAASAGPLTWGPEELKAEAKSNAVNLYTPSAVGMSMAPGGAGWYMLHGLTMPIFDAEGIPFFMSGDEISMVVHANIPPDEDYSAGDFLQLNLANNILNLTENITYAMYDEAAEQHNDKYGYDYRELSLSWVVPDTFDDDIYTAGAETGIQCRYHQSVLCGRSVQRRGDF